MRFALISIFLILHCIMLTSEVALSQDNHRRDRKLLFSNMAFGFISGSVGVAINDRSANFKDVIINGGIQGALGGSIMHIGKRQLYKFSCSERISDYWSSKLIFSAGTSIIENASLNKRFYDSYRFNYLFLRMQIDFVDGRIGFGINYSELLLATSYRILQSNKFDLDISRTLKYGVLISFDHKSNLLKQKKTRAQNSIYGGIQINSNLQGNELFYPVLSHELIHYYQDQQYSIASTWVNKRINLSLFGSSKNSAKRIYMFDEFLGPIFHDIVAYPIARLMADRNNYYSNFFESEAYHYCKQH